MQAENNPVGDVIETVEEEALNSDMGKPEDMEKTMNQPVKSAADPTTVSSSLMPSLVPEYNGVDRNAWLFGFNPQQELWNGRLAMLGFVAYLVWDLAGYSVLRDVLHWVR
jgi:hypothetical protein